MIVIASMVMKLPFVFALTAITLFWDLGSAYDPALVGYLEMVSGKITTGYVTFRNLKANIRKLLMLAV